MNKANSKLKIVSVLVVTLFLSSFFLVFTLHVHAATYTYFGYIKVGASEDEMANTYITAQRHQCNATGTLTTISLYCKTNSAAGKVTTFLYADSSGSPSTLLATSNEITVGTSYSWVNFTISYPVITTTYYWFGRMSDSTLYTKYDAGAANQWAYDGSLTYPTPSNPLNEDGTSANQAGMYGTVSNMYPYIQQQSDVDSVADVGSCSSFASQQNGPDNTNDTLTEANVPVNTNTTMLNDGFETSTNASIPNWDGNGATTWTGDGGILTAPCNLEGWSGFTNHAGSKSAGTGATGDGNLISDDIDMSTATAIYVSFWYAVDDTDGAGELVLKYYDGVGYDTIQDLSGGTEDTWTYYNVKITDSQYFDSTFRLQFVAACGSSEAVYVDDVLVIREVTSDNYRLSLEEEFTEIPTGYNTRELCVFAGNWTTAETLSVQGWNTTTTAWTAIGSLTANQWNNFTVNSIISDSATTLYIQFVDGTITSDSVQSSWSIDSAYIHVYNTTAGTNYPIALSYSQSFSSSVAVKWLAIFGLSQSITTTWSETNKWTALLGLSQALGTAWNRNDK